MDIRPSQRPTIPQVLLGLFVVWQFCFLLAGNFIAFFPHGQAQEGELSDSRAMPPGQEEQGPFQNVIETVAKATDFWSQSTGQAQAWWLFAPSFPKESTFPVVELRWDDGASSTSASASAIPPARLGSVIEPSDPQHYFRPPGSFDRLFHYEIRLGLIFWGWSAESLQEHPDLWREAVENRVRRQWKSMRAYLRWRVGRFQSEHPDLPPPRQALLLIRLYRTPKPGQEPPKWDGPIELPLARWLPHEDNASGSLPMQMCDPATGQFLVLKVKE